MEDVSDKETTDYLETFAQGRDDIHQTQNKKFDLVGRMIFELSLVLAEASRQASEATNRVKIRAFTRLHLIGTWL